METSRPFPAQVVLGRLFKVHPAFDDVLLDVLDRDRRGLVVLVAESQRQLTSLLVRRLRGAAGRRNLEAAVDARVRFVDYWNYVNVIAAARVVLDTHPYGGCLTALDALSNGVPLVVLPGKMERGRHAMSIYDQMNVTAFVATDAADYVDIAVTLGTDDNAHARAVHEIRARCAPGRIQLPKGRPARPTAPPARRYEDAHRAEAVAREWADAFLRMERSAI